MRTSAGYTGLGEVFAEALGRGFDGQDFSRFGFGAFAHLSPPSWTLLDSYLGGGNWGGAPAGPTMVGATQAAATRVTAAVAAARAVGGGSDFYVPKKITGDRGSDGGKGSYGTAPVTATPEPGSIVLFATGLLALVPVVRRRRRR